MDPTEAAAHLAVMPSKVGKGVSTTVPKAEDARYLGCFSSETFFGGKEYVGGASGANYNLLYYHAKQVRQRSNTRKILTPFCSHVLFCFAWRGLRHFFFNMFLLSVFFTSLFRGPFWFIAFCTFPPRVFSPSRVLKKVFLYTVYLTLGSPFMLWSRLESSRICFLIRGYVSVSSDIIWRILKVSENIMLSKGRPAQ